jgi:hypothetical protein
MASGVTGDFGRLTGTIAALKSLARIPAQVAGRAAPRIKSQMEQDTRAAVDPYGRGYAPHMPATIKRWGVHPLLDLTGAGIGSLDAQPMAGAGISVTADEHMAFTQAGTPTQEVRAVMPNSPQLPATWNRILSEESEALIKERLRSAK